MNYFSADFHLGHANIIRYCNRPFANIKEHDETILKKINDVVAENDTLFILGDFCFGNPVPYRMLIHCKNVHFILGSHDKQITRDQNLFTTVFPKRVISIENKTVVMTHCAHLVWEQSHYGSYHLFGHSHNRLGTFDDEYGRAIKLILSRARCMDVGVDGHDFWPYSWTEIDGILSKKEGFVVQRRNDQNK